MYRCRSTGSTAGLHSTAAATAAAPSPRRHRALHPPHFRHRTRARNEHIIPVQYSVQPTGLLPSEPVGTIVARIDNGSVFHSHNDRTGTEAAVLTRRSTVGDRYIATTSNGVESDNLLSPPGVLTVIDDIGTVPKHSAPEFERPAPEPDRLAPATDGGRRLLDRSCSRTLGPARGRRGRRLDRTHRHRECPRHL
ncbi:hypothetical protein C5C18_01580 [Rathayibacter tritici]|nr:hypothetical protein C5C21_02670 [Rathayibacter tritici]PPG09097.1 hypothetical protein C5C18_01580 [Rathayibacter tritici]